jgi:hypothetical protein
VIVNLLEKERVACAGMRATSHIALHDQYVWLPQIVLKRPLSAIHLSRGQPPVFRAGALRELLATLINGRFIALRAKSDAAGISNESLSQSWPLPV